MLPLRFGRSIRSIPSNDDYSTVDRSSESRGPPFFGVNNLVRGKGVLAIEIYHNGEEGQNSKSSQCDEIIISTTSLTDAEEGSLMPREQSNADVMEQKSSHYQTTIEGTDRTRKQTRQDNEDAAVARVATSIMRGC